MTRFIVGIDEAGRGPLAGPLSVAAVCLPYGKKIEKICVGITDSKKLSTKKRQEFFNHITSLKDVRFTHSHVMPTTLDRLGMTRALHVAIYRVLAKLNLSPSQVNIKLDGTLKAPVEYKNQKTIIKGDITEPIISAASVIAKVKRDKSMIRYGREFPEYGFERHKGYGTHSHIEAIRQRGPCRIHRRSFLRNLNTAQ